MIMAVNKVAYIIPYINIFSSSHIVHNKDKRHNRKLAKELCI